MNGKTIFLREKGSDDVNPQIMCDTSDLKEVITNWTENEGWEYDDFAEFLNLIGVKTPVTLCEYNKNRSFKCVSAEKVIQMTILFGDWIDFSSELHVTDGDETRIFEINTNFNKGITVPQITLRARILKGNGKELFSYYCDYFCNRELKWGDGHVLRVELDESGKYEDKSEIIVLRNFEEVESYLFGLEKNINVKEVKKRIIEILDYPNADILDDCKISYY